MSEDLRPDGPALVQLPPVMDIGAAEPLFAEIVSLRGRPLALDASLVERLGGLCLQVLVAARAAWSADGHTLVISQPSRAFQDAWSLFAAPLFAFEANSQGAEP